VLRAIAGWIPWLVGVFCVSIITASVDRLPDPPAIKPHCLSIQALSVSTPLHGPTHCTAATLSFFSAWLSTKRFCSSQISESFVPAYRPALMQDAADASPPYPVL
jgi:hypothetical protein